MVVVRVSAEKVLWQLEMTLLTLFRWGSVSSVLPGMVLVEIVVVRVPGFRTELPRIITLQSPATALGHLERLLSQR